MEDLYADRYTTGASADPAYISKDRAVLDDLTPLARIRARIETNVKALDGIGEQLRSHASRVSGHEPEDAQNSAGRPSPAVSGMLEEIDEALRELDRAVSFVSYQSGRNCTLA